jgi:hypothetical protein
VLLILLSSAVFAVHAAEAPLELAPDAPKRHVVVRGDTLWDISSKFLRDPFRWPELWGFNKDQIRNPHWIYPGQVLVLYYVDGQPRLRIDGQGNGDVPTVKLQPEVRVTDASTEIPAIPQQVIEPFLSQPLIVDEGILDTAPRIVATQYNHSISGDNDLAYVTGLKADQKALWQIFRPGKMLKDPITQEVIGQEAVFLGTARVVKDGDPATVKILSVKQETGKNDLLVKAPRPEIINYPMHRPTTALDARVVSNYGDSNAGGKYSIIAISGGQKNGLEVGHVLALSRTGTVVTDRYKGTKRDVVLPDERYGLVYVFRTFQKVSYAVVMETMQPVEVGDKVSAP